MVEQPRLWRQPTMIRPHRQILQSSWLGFWTRNTLARIATNTEQAGYQRARSQCGCTDKKKRLEVTTGILLRTVSPPAWRPVSPTISLALIGCSHLLACCLTAVRQSTLSLANNPHHDLSSPSATLTTPTSPHDTYKSPRWN